MTLSNLTEEQRRSLIAMFMSPGWALLRKELDARAGLAVKKIVYTDDHSKDDEHRGLIKCVDYLFGVEKAVFTPTPIEEVPPPPPSDDRYAF